METFKAKVTVKLKPEIKDVKGETLASQFKGLKCRTGNVYWFEFEAKSKTDAEKFIKKLSDEILSNNVIEEYEIKW